MNYTSTTIDKIDFTKLDEKAYYFGVFKNGSAFYFTKQNIIREQNAIEMVVIPIAMTVEKIETVSEILKPVTWSYWDSHQHDNALQDEGEYVKVEDAEEAMEKYK